MAKDRKKFTTAKDIRLLNEWLKRKRELDGIRPKKHLTFP